MRCKLCEKPTDKFFCVYHDECIQQLKLELSVMTLIYENYQNNFYSWKVAKTKFIENATTGYTNKFFTNNITNKSDIDTHDKVVYSYSGIEVLEEKNRCKMKCTGKSYARYSQWEPATYRISNSSTIVLTDRGLYILRPCVLHFPYSKIVNFGIDDFLGTAYFYFDVKTTSPHRHRYTIKVPDRKQAHDITKHLYQISELMSGIRER